MDYKKIACIIFVVALLIAAAFILFPQKSYTINNATLNMTVSEFGSVYVQEDCDYHFNGEFNGVYRDIPLKYGEDFRSFRVLVDGAYYDLEENDTSDGKHLKVHLYSDSEHTKKIKDCDVHITYRYSIDNVVTIYDDVGVLQYKLWDKDWDVGIDGLKATVKFPGNTNNTYYINPEKFTKTSILKGDTLTISTNPIPKWEIYELLVMMPADDLTNNSYIGKHAHGNGKDLVLQNLNESLEKIKYNDTIFLIYEILACMGPVLLILTYLRYGREPKVDYSGVYERQPPSDDPPERVNSIFGTYSYIGQPSRDGFEASILNIIDKKIIRITLEKDGETGDTDLILTFNNERMGELSKSEAIIFDTLSGFAKDNVLYLSTLKKRLTIESNAKWYMDKFRTWKKTVEEENTQSVNKYFNKKGLKISRYIEAIWFVLGIILTGFALFQSTPSMRMDCFKLGIVIGLTGVVAYFLPDDYFGQWTPEGRVLHLKWQNFKKFLKDNSLINEHPPESIVIWKKYLIYGASLGVTKKVYKALTVNVPDFHESDDAVFMYHNYGGFTAMDSAIKTGEYWADPPSDSGGSSGSGSFGGGSGGGGGGAF